VFQGGPEVLPEHRIRARVIRREQEGQHVEQSAAASDANPQPEHEREPNGELAVCYEERDRVAVRQYEASEDRHHEGIRAVLRKKPLDPALEATAKHEFTSEDLVLAECQEEEADGDSESGQGTVIPTQGIARAARNS